MVGGEQTPVKIRKANKTAEITKSPSDSTLYEPALKKIVESECDSDSLINKISNFVEGIRLETVGKTSPVPGTSQSPQLHEHRREKTPTTQVILGPVELARNYIVDAENMKAMVEIPPKGMFDLIKPNPADNDNDDDFFHLACHVDSTLKAKIERGEFVDLK